MIKETINNIISNTIKNTFSFTPLSLNPSAWYDPNDGSTVAHADGSVSQLIDKSGNNNHATQTTVVNQPIYPVSINGLNALQCGGGGTSKILLTNTYSLKEVISVIYLEDTSPIAFVCANSGNTQELFFKRNSSVSFDGSGSGTGAYSINGEAYSVDLANHSDAVIPATFIGAGKFTTNLNVTRVFGRSSFGNVGDSYFGETIAFDRELSNSERAQVTSYLANKWSIEL